MLKPGIQAGSAAVAFIVHLCLIACICSITSLLIVAFPPSCAFASTFSPLILTSENIEQFDKLISSSEEKNCIILQVKPELMDENKAKILMNWVRRGGVLWYYDSRMAHLFSMKNAPFEAGDIPFKRFEGEYGSEKKQPGIAVGCLAWGNHSLTTGIRKVLVFVLELDKGKYSAVADEGVLPLLKIDRTSKYSIAALMKVGRGSVIFKPLLWEDQYDGRDFQRMLIKYSSKDPVPFPR
jgi:hypothetical protein